MPDDRDLLRRASDGDAAAWRELLDLHGPFVLGLARHLLRRMGSDGTRPEDLVQEVWTSLLSGGGRDLRSGRGLRPYLSAAVVHAALRHRRGNARRRAREQERPLPSPSSEAPEEPLLGTERSEEVEEALRRLGPEEALLLRWVYWDALPYARVARLRGISENSVGPLLSRARENLRGILERNNRAREGGAAGPGLP